MEKLTAAVLVAAATVLMAPLVASEGAAAAGAPSPVAASAPSTDWTVYHGNLRGSGLDHSGSSFTPATPAWTSPTLDGQLFGEPLTLGGRVFVATENDTVDALAATTGAVLWSTHLGTAVPSSALPCGDISPTVGITGTPVIDRARHEIFVVADEMVNGSPAHELVGLNVATGAVELTQDVDPAGSTPAAQLQRTGLTLDAGRVVFGYGGNSGDCSTYHGWVIAVPEAGGTPATFEVDSGPGQSRGAVWMGGAAPVVDGQGHVWVATGNGSVTSPGPYDDSDGVLNLNADLTLRQFFAPSNWYSDNAADADLGSSSPALVPYGPALQVGKGQVAYLLDRAHLGGIGGQVASLSSVCGSTVDGGGAVSGSVVYTPCTRGVEAFQVGTSPAGLTKLWQTSSGSGGPAIIAGGLIWTISQGGVLYGLDPSTGTASQALRLGSVANHFPTPAVGDHLLLAAASTTVVAFKGPGAAPVPPQNPPAG